MRHIEYEPHHWRLLRLRAAAALLDLIGVFAVSDLCRLVNAVPWTVRDGGSSLSRTTIHPVGLVICVLAVFAWFVVPEVLLGASVGKRLMHLRVYSSTGLPSITQVVVRNVTRIVDFPVLYIFGGLVAAISPAGQRVGDLLARTRVGFDS